MFYNVVTMKTSFATSMFSFFVNEYKNQSFFMVLLIVYTSFEPIISIMAIEFKGEVHVTLNFDLILCLIKDSSSDFFTHLINVNLFG
jgi:hypothetical protein